MTFARSRILDAATAVTGATSLPAEIPASATGDIEKLVGGHDRLDDREQRLGLGCGR